MHDSEDSLAYAQIPIRVINNMREQVSSSTGGGALGSAHMSPLADAANERIKAGDRCPHAPRLETE